MKGIFPLRKMKNKTKRNVLQLLQDQCFTFGLFGGTFFLDACWAFTAVASCPVAVAFCPLATYSVLLSLGIADETACVVTVFVLTACVCLERPDVWADAIPAMPKINTAVKKIFFIRMHLNYHIKCIAILNHALI